MLIATPQLIRNVCKPCASLTQSIKFLGLSINFLVAVLLPRAFVLLFIQIAINDRGASEASWFQSNNNNQLPQQQQQQIQPVVLNRNSLDNLVAIEPKKSSPLYECELSFLQVDLSLIKFSISYLQLEHKNTQSTTRDGFSLREINLNASVDELAASTKLDAELPFVFFINGFNTFAPDEAINTTWMYQVAKSFAVRAQEYKQKRGTMNELKLGNNKTIQSSASGLLSWLSRYFSTKSTSNDNEQTKRNQQQDELFASGRNVIFLTWSIPDLFASNLFAMIPAYYRTVANYDLIVDYVARTVAKFVHFAELNGQFDTVEMRSEYYSKFQFYGHSLGSHILSDAILRVVNSMKLKRTNSSSETQNLKLTQNIDERNLESRWQFGKLMGLDPATPCFVSKEHGISSWRVREAVREVAVLHSNAGFAGVPNERANVEIVLNGGTFQPGCAWYDFACSHVRSTDILSYIDDDCQMVAYKCTSYNHFKLGACELCSDDSSFPLHYGAHEVRQGSGGGHCALVNLPEQHQDKPDVLAYVELANNKTRRLASASIETESSLVEFDGQKEPSGGWIKRQWSRYRFGSDHDDESQIQSGIKLQQTSSRPIKSDNLLNVTRFSDEKQNDTRSKANYFHYVNTNPNFRSGRQTHCLQHYQLRLLIYQDDDDLLQLRNKCKLSNFYIKSSDETKLKLFYETAADSLNGSRPPQDGRRQSSSLKSELIDDQDSDQTRTISKRVKLNPIVKDVFMTALVNFESAPKLFVGAELKNVDLVGLAKCYKRQNATSGGPKFVLDIAFMSHIRAEIRHAFSSVLCLQLDLDERYENTEDTTESQTNRSSERRVGTTTSGRNSMLNLCKQSELKDVSAKIDKLLNQIRLQLLDETWKVSLLNSLFSLFTEWEPF